MSEEKVWDVFKDQEPVYIGGIRFEIVKLDVEGKHTNGVNTGQEIELTLKSVPDAESNN